MPIFGQEVPYADPVALIGQRGSTDGTGMSAADIAVADVAGVYTATDAEGVFAELPQRFVSLGGESSAATAATTPITVKGAASQTADLVVAKNSAGSTLAKIDKDGVLVGAHLHLSSGTRAVRHDSSTQLGLGEGYAVVNVRPGVAGVKGLVLFSGSGTSVLASGENVVYIANCTVAPSGTPSGGGVLYCEAGALKFKGSSGTVTTIASA